MRQAGRFQDRQGAEDIHLSAQKGVRPAGRHLQTRQMDDVRDFVLRDGAAEGGQVRDVAGHKHGAGRLGGGQNLEEAARVLFQIEDVNRVALLQQVANDPSPDEAITSGQ